MSEFLEYMITAQAAYLGGVSVYVLRYYLVERSIPIRRRVHITCVAISYLLMVGIFIYGPTIRDPRLWRFWILWIALALGDYALLIVFLERKKSSR